IHPGLHSADICCSVAITVLAEADPRAALDAASAVTHFGGGGRQRGQQIRPPAEVMEGFAANPILERLQSTAIEHFATQGDGNHFFFVGRLASSGQTALVTHHGSRKPGAMLYKRGMELAEAHRRRVSPETQKINAWIEAESDEGRAYWDALQTMRAWTKANHFALHDRVMEALSARAADRFWNEHNFVFRRGDVYLHGKGATPAWSDYAEDASGEVLIPLNMAEPVLIARGRDADHGLGFCPHGAGRDFSRSEHQRRMAGIPVEELVARETQGIDARFHCGRPDASELPSAYKRADHVVAQIERFGLAEIVDRVEPFGCIMAGDWTKRFRDVRAAKRARREAGKAQVEAQAEDGASG
ncbi:MAG: RtcB family protein, partial [Pseudomonadota bacterium]